MSHEYKDIEAETEKQPKRIVVFSKDAVISEILSSAALLGADLIPSLEIETVPSAEPARAYRKSLHGAFAIFADLDSFTREEVTVILDSSLREADSIECFAVGKSAKSEYDLGAMPIAPTFLRRPMDLRFLLELFRQADLKPPRSSRAEFENEADSRRDAPFDAHNTAARSTLANGAALLVYIEASNCFFYGEHRLSLTATEQRLLLSLYKKRGTAVPREELAEAVWNGEKSSNVIDVYINYLRSKLDHRFNTRLITSVRRKGYMLLS